MLHKTMLALLFAISSALALAEGIKVGVSGDYPPLVYKHEGRIVGIEADSAKAVGEVLGKEMILMDLPFEELIPALQLGKVDVIMAGLSVTPERSELVTFIEPYMNIGQMAIMSTDKVGRFSQPWSIYQEGVRIGVEPGTTGAIFAEEKLPDAQVILYANPTEAFAGLRRDQIDLYIHDAPTSWQLATSPDNTDLISLYHSLTDEQLAWAVRKDDTALAAALNDALRTLKKNGTLGYIFSRWIPVTVEVR
ncbi:MAG: transporter substrate-binding domain-containing protein [Halioglobus sp.]|nr:transporter substrate-binding domain-containing protein [Halioglobus sp.]